MSTTPRNLFIADTQNNRFRKAAAGTGIVSTVLATGDTTGMTIGPDGTPYGSSYGYIWIGFAPPPIPCFFPQYGYTLTNCYWEEYGTPQGIRFDGPGSILIANSSTFNRNSLAPVYGAVHKLDLSNGALTTLAGNGSPTSGIGENVPATSIGIIPVDVALDAAGNLYIADVGLWRIRKVDATTGPHHDRRRRIASAMAAMAVRQSKPDSTIRPESPSTLPAISSLLTWAT